MAPKRVVRPLVLGALLLAGGIVFALSPPGSVRAATAKLSSSIEAASQASAAQVEKYVSLKDVKNADEYLASLKAYYTDAESPEQEEVDDPLMLSIPENMRDAFHYGDGHVLVPGPAPPQDRFYRPSMPTYE
ncbi:hypothetical protein SEPCBS119000_004049 [Sporothrix epigloea]|uniref:Uncharacterized protein n=1 Tax=Sporothrix epigloea TaxID=1892477 RepID=A0ABP0DQ05_9PEZI